MTLERGILISGFIEELISDYCDKFDVAGSIRRGNRNPNDIEIVIQPKPKMRSKIGALFLKNGARINSGTFGGRQIKMLFMGQKIDFFIPLESQYFRILALRTGGKKTSKYIVNKESRNGFLATKEGVKPKCLHPENEKAITWNSEKEFFNWLGIEYLEPKDRM